ncbi:sugar kinase [Microbacterium testaceum]|uniref:sugar kinase n=1 Tax=Microbacterium testaceum TaxID=2033 RepID=UPI00380C2373
MTRVVTLGETMALARTTEVGSLRHAAGLALGIGGAETNVAVGLRRLGVDAAWLGRVGDDPLGERIARELRGEGLDVRAIVDTEAPTGLMLKERPSAASTAVHYYRRGSAGSRLSPDDVPAGWIENADLLHVTGITPLLSDTARATVLAAVERARAAGVAVSFDVNYRSALASPEVAGPILRDIAARSILVFGGVEEFALMSPDAAESLLESGVQHVVVKRGPRGATAFTTAGATEAPGFVIDPLDTVGAGDAFVAGYLSAHLEGLDVADTLVRGNACGAMACLVPGDWEAAPTRRDLERFLAGGGDPVRR